VYVSTGTQGGRVRTGGRVLTIREHIRNDGTISEAKWTYQRRKNEPHTIARRAYFLRWRLGISKEESLRLAEMVSKPESMCECCGVTRLSEPLFVDHSQKTGKVRGILCHGCNTAIGLLNDSPEKADAAAAYLRKTMAKEVAEK